MAVTHRLYEIGALRAVAGSLVFRGKVNGDTSEFVLDGQEQAGEASLLLPRLQARTQAAEG